ncbi:MAG: hypothetical protein ACO1PI_14670 [Bacteroidota bacterium]
MKPIAAVGVLILLLAACTGKRYGHYGYVKRGEKKAAVKTNPIKNPHLKQPESLASKGISFSILGKKDTSLPNAILKPVTTPLIVRNELTDRGFKAPLTTTTIKTADDNAPKPHKKAGRSLGYGLVAYVVILIPILGIAFSIAFAIIAIRRGMEALREMDAEPEKYTNRASAIAGVALGIIFLSILIFAILMLMFSAVGFTIPFIPFF